MSRFAIAALLATLGIASGASAQTQAQSKQPSAEDVQKNMDAAMGSMMPMMERMSTIMIEAQLKVAAKPETAERVAAFKKNLYDALVNKGFTREQALQVTMATALPSGAAMGK